MNSFRLRAEAIVVGSIALALGTAQMALAGGCTSAPTFGTAISFAVGNDPHSAVVGDFNDDHLDIVVANETADTASILLGTGNGSFGPVTPFNVVDSSPLSVAVGDFNGDDHLDLATANAGAPGGNTVSILLGFGNGSFATATPFTVGVEGASAVSVAAGYFNGDGHLDLATANLGDNTVAILLGTGTGSFGAATPFAVGNRPIFVAVGDFNGDDHVDLAVATNGDNTVWILLGTGTGTFGAATPFAVGKTPAFIVVRDFNGDGHLDFAVANAGDNTVSILLGTGTGSFEAATPFAVGKTPVSVATGDFNGDDHLDLATANQDDDTVSILLGTGTGSFGAATPFAVGKTPDSVAVGDFNHDGLLDLVVVNDVDGTVSVLLNTCLENTNACCQCPTSCAAPINNSCGECVAVLDAICEGGALCVLPTPTPAATPTPGANDCCQCADFCGAPIAGTCGGCSVVHGASCDSGSLCISRTPLPTKTPAGNSCVGDCDGSGAVSTDELITLVNIALGTPDASACRNGIPTSAEVDIAMVIKALNNAVNGCALNPAEQGCLNSGGTVASAMCCAGTGDFPDTCAVGACGCAPASSHPVRVCTCGTESCFDGTECARP